MLCAAIRFVVCDPGIRRIYYHSPISGPRLKGVKDASVSLYTGLPRFLTKRRRKDRADLWMHQLCL